MKLKTLIDIETMRDSFGNIVEYSCDKRELKKEAINHINKWEDEMKDIKINGFTQFHLLSKIDLFKYFFNITEEDLDLENDCT